MKKKKKQDPRVAAVVLATAILAVIAIVAIKPQKASAHKVVQGTEGIDVSHHQGTIDWKKVAASGNVAFVYVKVTEGTKGPSAVDSSGSFNVKSARKNGLNVGAYHFLSSVSSVEDQFANFKAHYPREANLKPVIDFERTGRLSAAELRKRLGKFAHLMEKVYGVKPVIYTSQSIYNRIIAPDLESYKDNIFFIGSPDHAPVLSDGRSSYIWQYDMKAVPGIKGKTDSNKLVGVQLSDLMMP